MNHALDSMQLQFNPNMVFILQAVLALVIFGISLELSFNDFRRLLRSPKPLFVGLFSQLVCLPLLTLGLIVVFEPIPSIALGLMLTAACPGGNMSNVLTHWSGGRTAVSMSLTTFSSLISPLTTPLTFMGLSQLHPSTAKFLQTIHVPMQELIFTICVALVLPLILGMTIAQTAPVVAKKLEKILKKLSLVIFLGFIIMAIAANIQLFLPAMSAIFTLVLVHNALALATGFGLASAFKLPMPERKAITFETGIHNTALGLMLIFAHYHGMGGMALVVAWWGVWHLVTGGILARFWAQRENK